MATINFPEHPSPVADAEALRKAVQGLGTDEKAVITILGRRNAVQRKQIREAYEDLYKEDLVKRLENELTGDFEKVVYRWILDPEDRDAVLLHLAIKARDYCVVAEISCVHSPEELLAFKRAYQARYRHSVEEDLSRNTTGEMRKLLLGLVGTYRYVGGEVDARLAKSEADVLHSAIKEKAFDHEEVVRVLTTRSKAQVVATINQYKDDHSSPITKHLRDDPSSEYLTTLRLAIRCIVDHKKYFEKVIRVALNKAGTDEDSLTRVVASRAEKDLMQIKELYLKRNSVRLEDAVAKETSGDYKDFLLALLGKSD